MSAPRYMVQSEHVRGERRVYYVIDRQAYENRTDRYSSSGVACTRATTDRRTAERQCDKLNGAKP